jgi:DNA (cytosine-5)-methyltransferase 1
MIRFADLFSGIGGFRLGIEQASESAGIPVKCVFSSEIEKNAVRIYEKNFKETPHGDITQINAADIPDMDILCGGPPCQSFSIAGKRLGFKDDRGKLFFEVIRIAAVKKPKMLFLENVKGLLSSDSGRDFAQILIALDDAGYDVEWQCIDSAGFLPQHRERVFIIGHIREKPTGKIFPLIRETVRICDEPNKTEEELRKTASTLTRRMYASWNGNYVLHDNSIRTLTPTECEKLQGFPIDWTETVEDKYRYKCLGNAVTVPVIKAISEKILMELYKCQN